MARSAGADFVAVGDVIDEPLRRLADLGIDGTINVATEADRLARHAEGKGTFDIVFEASGSAGATISALDVVKPRGTFDSDADISGMANCSQITVRSSRCTRCNVRPL